MSLTILKSDYNSEVAMAKPLDNRFFRDMVASMSNGVLSVRRDGGVVFVNDPARRILGLPDMPGGWPGGDGVHYSELLRDYQELVRLFASAFEMSTLPNRAELRLKPSGRVIGYTLSLVCDDRGRVHGASLFFKDLTLVEQAEERERLRDRLAALGEMAATIAHEVKNPLASIEVMAGLLRRQLADRGDLQGMLTDIINEAKMANSIVCEVLEFVRPIRLQVDRTDLFGVVGDAIPLAERKVARRDTLVDVIVPRDLPVINGDHHQLCQVVTNLLINALEALGGRGAIQIRAREVHADRDGLPAAVELRISDDGPGIPLDVKERMFNPFFSTKPQGSGLGLAIVRKIVDAHDGRVDVTTAPGEGTTFTIVLPIAVPGQLAF
jgi:signal transduction histidine kinase